jgi:AMMECR1 domain-containing protein
MKNQDDSFITFVMYHALFGKKLFENETEEKMFETYIPENVFGVFSTIRRGEPIPREPIDIHGCIGYWEKNFNTMTKHDVYLNMLQVSYDSLWSDNRRESFPPIETDPESLLELDFMMNPIYPIDKQTGRITISTFKKVTFSNNVYGIIIQSKDKKQKATYLPNVFKNISWDEIIFSIKQKAHIAFEDYDVYAYKIKQVKARFIDMLTRESFCFISIYHFSRLLLENMDTSLRFPFVYLFTNGRLERNTEDDVRNISTLSDVYKYIHLFPILRKKYRLQSDFLQKKVLEIMKNTRSFSSQSLSFLGYLYSNSSKKNPFKKLFCEKLTRDFSSADKEFAQPQIIIGLNEAGCHVPLDGFPYNTLNSKDSLFKINWVIQAMVSLDEKLPRAWLMQLDIVKKIELLLRNPETETNYLAVAFEMMCFVYASTNDTYWWKPLFALFYELEKRKTCHNILYAFLNETARIDITGHILNGFIEMRSIPT